ncbi:MAG: D-2-hydroxyacid dehydrogenase family protein [Burkholderiales bacterium]|nr:D-2-hydroxyacid dehydrogenase family protein [Burkholderiales bacterium]
MSSKPTIVVLDDFERVAADSADWSTVRSRADLRIHQAPLRGDALLQALVPADAIVLMRDRTPLLAPLIAQLPNLKLVVFTGTRNGALDAKALAARGIPVAHTGWGPNKDATTELTWALILAAQKRITTHDAGLRRGDWRPLRTMLPVLHGQRIGVVGLGEIGGRVAGIARAFGMEVVTWSPNMTAERAEAKGARSVPFDELLATSHIISTHLVMGPATRGLFGATQFAAMRPDAVFVNTSRAGLIDEAALVAALAKGRPGVAALDVFSEEPLPTQHPLLALPNVVLTPHLGFVAEPVFRRFYADVVDTLTAWLAGAPLPRLLPPT